MEQMTSRERITAVLTGQPVDRLPFSPFLAYVWEFFPADIRERGMLAFHHLVGADPLWRGAACPVSASTPGVTWDTQDKGAHIVTVITTPVGTLRQVSARSAEGNTCFLVEHPLKSAEDFKVQCWIEEHTVLAYDPTSMRQHLQGDGREGLSLGMLIPRSKSAFQSMVEHHVGTEELMYALEDYPEMVDQLWQTMVAVDLQAVRLAAEADYDYFLTWEDSSTQNYSPALYDRYIGAEIRQWCAALAPHGKRYVQHACGHVRELIGSMVADGVYAVESVASPPTGNIPLREIRARGGRQFGIIGGIEPTELLHRTPEQLAPYVEQVIADAAGGPFLLANADSCPPGVSVEKFKLIADLVRGLRR